MAFIYYMAVIILFIYGIFAVDYFFKGSWYCEPTIIIFCMIIVVHLFLLCARIFQLLRGKKIP